MFRRTAAAAAGALLLLGAASWLPAHASGPAGGPTAAADLARPALPPPAARPFPAPGAVAAVSGFFWSLSAAVAGGRTAPRSASAAGAAAGPPATEALAQAYAYLAPSWRAAEPFANFTRRWSGTRALDLLAALPAGPPPGDPRAERIFVEVRTLTEVGNGDARAALEFASGFYTAEPSPQGWLLRAGQLRPEAFGLGLAAGGEGPSAAAVAAARTLARSLGLPGARAAAQVHLTSGTPGRANAGVRLGADTFTVSLYQLVDGQWVVLRTTR